MHNTDVQHHKLFFYVLKLMQ